MCGLERHEITIQNSNALSRTIQHEDQPDPRSCVCLSPHIPCRSVEWNLLQISPVNILVHRRAFDPERRTTLDLDDPETAHIAVVIVYRDRPMTCMSSHKDHLADVCIVKIV